MLDRCEFPQLILGVSLYKYKAGEIEEGKTIHAHSLHSPVVKQTASLLAAILECQREIPPIRRGTKMRDGYNRCQVEVRFWRQTSYGIRGLDISITGLSIVYQCGGHFQ